MKTQPPNYLVRKAEFLVSAVRPSQWPADGWPEIAFAGRSNVGKSSLINTLVMRKRLVKTSSTPGKTRQINFFNVDDRWNFADLPGYGWAKVSKSERAKWGPMIETYLDQREPLRAVALLLDFRRIPNEDDRMMVEFLATREIDWIPVLTKADKLSANGRAKVRRVISAALAPYFQPSMAIEFSSLSGEGREELWERLETFAENPPAT